MEVTLQRLITKQLRALTADQAWTMSVLGTERAGTCFSFLLHCGAWDDHFDVLDR